ncbi:MAG: ATP-binding protein [bacterium]
MQYGGYPRVVLSDSNEEKRFVLENIYDTYLLREIKEIMQLSKDDQLIKLLKALALQIGNMLQYNELAQISGFNFNTLKKYMYILEQTFICKRCLTFYTNKRLEIVKVPKIYFLDHGFRNQCAGDFWINEQQVGAFYENLVYSENLKKGIELKYWRTTSQAEVDFIKDERIPIEIKKRPKVTRAFQSFIKKYQPEEGYVISEIEKESIIKNGCKIHFLPFGKFI